MTFMRKLRGSVASGALATALVGLGTVSAAQAQVVDQGAGQNQSQSQSTGARDPGEQATAVEDIVVTARKREERLVDVPIAIAAVTGEALERRGVTSVSTFLATVPGVGAVDGGDGISKITIRGVSTSLGANENGYYLDDLPFTGVTVPLAPDVRAWDLDRVEVLRGPQGTLFGEGALGGTIRMLTADADLHDWLVKANVTGSNTDGGGSNSGIKGTVNIPIIEDKLAVRFAATHEEFDGWIDSTATGREDVNAQTFDTFRAKVRFDPTDRLSLRATYWSFEGDFPGGGVSATDSGQESRSTVLATNTKYELIGASARYELDGSELFYGYSNNSFELPQNGNVAGGILNIMIGIDVEAHELRWSSTGSERFQWTIGAYRRDAKRSDDFQFSLFQIDNTSSTESTAEALFGEASYALASMPIDFTVGLRYFRDDLSNQEFNSDVPEKLISAKYDSFNPRFIVAWRPQVNLNVYVSAAKGFRSGQTQPLTAVALAEPYGIVLPPTLNQDSIWTYEIGAKADLMDRLLSVEAAVYYSKWKDVTVRIPIANTGLNGLINSKGTETRGVEVSLLSRPIEGLTLAVAGAYTDAEYLDAVAETGIVPGAPVDDVSKFTASASADYRFPLRGDAEGFARLAWQHASPRRFTSFPAYEQGDSVNRVDARLGVDFDRVSIALFADNLLNEDGAISYRTRNDIAPGDVEFVSPRFRPRTIGLELNMRFGSGF